MIDLVIFAQYQFLAEGRLDALVAELQAHLDPRRLDKIVERYNDQTQDNRRDAISRARALRKRLQERRPGVILDTSHVPGTQTETKQ